MMRLGMPGPMPGHMPGVLGDVDDSGALAIRPENGESRQETWRKRSSTILSPAQAARDINVQAADNTAQRTQTGVYHQSQVYTQSPPASSGDDSAQCAPCMAVRSNTVALIRSD